MDKTPIIQPNIEVKQERILTKEEVLEKIYSIGGEVEGLEVLAEHSDEKGLCSLVTRNTRIMDPDNIVTGFTYCRKGLHENKFSATVTGISTVYYDGNDIVGGQNSVEFDEDKNVWVDYLDNNLHKPDSE